MKINVYRGTSKISSMKRVLSLEYQADGLAKNITSIELIMYIVI